MMREYHVNSCTECETRHGKFYCKICTYYPYRIAFRVISIIFSAEVFTLAILLIREFAVITTAEASFLKYGNPKTIADYTTVISFVVLVLVIAGHRYLIRLMGWLKTEIELQQQLSEKK